MLEAEKDWRPHIQARAEQQATELADAHTRVRASDRRGSGEVQRGMAHGRGRVQVRAQQPTDILGIYVFLPAN